MKTGKTSAAWRLGQRHRRPAMEPGHEDREDEALWRHLVRYFDPQWSPVMKTGKTSRAHRHTPATWRRNGARS